MIKIMAKALITLGSATSHGGVVTECDSSFLINGIAVHLNGMKHYCPKCKAAVAAIARGFTMDAIPVAWLGSTTIGR